MKENYHPQEIPDGYIEEQYDELSSFKALKYFVRRDFEKINGHMTFGKLMRSLLIEPGFKFIFWMRITRYYFLKGKKALLIFLFFRAIMKHYAYKYTFDITYRTPIGPGFSIAHFGYIVIAAKSIGSNCFMRPGIVIGKNLKGGHELPSLGDNVHIGAGAKIVGNITIGNNVLIGANAVVTHDVPSNCVMGGIPAQKLRTLEEVIVHPVE